MFSNDGVEYIRRDVEGSDVDTRRRCETFSGFFYFFLFFSCLCFNSNNLAVLFWLTGCVNCFSLARTASDFVRGQRAAVRKGVRRSEQPALRAFAAGTTPARQLALPARVAERSDLHRAADPHRRVLRRGGMGRHSTLGRRRLSAASSPTQRPVGMAEPHLGREMIT